MNVLDSLLASCQSYMLMAASSWTKLMSMFICWVSGLLRLILLAVGFCCLMIRSRWFLYLSESFLNSVFLWYLRQNLKAYWTMLCYNLSTLELILGNCRHWQ